MNTVWHSKRLTACRPYVLLMYLVLLLALGHSYGICDVHDDRDTLEIMIEREDKAERKRREELKLAYSEWQVRKLYREVLGREPDPGGLKHYRGVVQHEGVAAARRYLAKSDEAKSLVNGIYKEILHRAADPGGLGRYTDALARDWLLSDVRHHIAMSTEALDANEIYAFDVQEISIALDTHNGHYVCAQDDGLVVANRPWVKAWESFQLVHVENGQLALKAHNGKYLCAEGGGGGAVRANRDRIGPWETFRLVPVGGVKVAIQTTNGQFLSAKQGGGSSLVADGRGVGSCESFRLRIVDVSVLPEDRQKEVLDFTLRSPSVDVTPNTPKPGEESLFERILNDPEARETGLSCILSSGTAALACGDGKLLSVKCVIPAIKAGVDCYAFFNTVSNMSRQEINAETAQMEKAIETVSNLASQMAAAETVLPKLFDDPKDERIERIFERYKVHGDLEHAIREESHQQCLPVDKKFLQ